MHIRLQQNGTCIPVGPAEFFEDLSAAIDAHNCAAGTGESALCRPWRGGLQRRRLLQRGREDWHSAIA